jgi:hypothetical protein
MLDEIRMALAVRSRRSLPYPGGSMAGAHAAIEIISCPPFPRSKSFRFARGLQGGARNEHGDRRLCHHF